MTLSGRGRRTKGLVGEREVAKLFRNVGFEVRGLEASGDHLIVCAPGLTLHVEVKRQERLRIPEWVAQAEAEAPPMTLPIVAYRRSNEKWRVVIPLEDFAAILSMTNGRP